MFLGLFLFFVVPEKELNPEKDILDPIIKILFENQPEIFSTHSHQHQTTNNENNKIEVRSEIEKTLLLGENSDRRKIITALLPDSIVKINNSSKERQTNWFGTVAESRKSAAGPVRMATIHWLVDKILAKQQKIRQNFLFLDDEDLMKLFPMEFKNYFNESLEHNNNQNDDNDDDFHDHEQNPQFLQHVFNMKICTLFLSSPSYQEVFRNENYLRSYFTSEIQR